MRRAILIFGFALLLFAVTSANAQMVTVKEKPSFYLGKRSNITLSLAFQPVLSPTKPKVTNLSIHPYLRAEITYNFALNNKVAIYLRGALNKSSREESSRETYSIYDDFGSREFYITEEGMPVMKGQTIGVGLSFYRRKKAALAPMGSHFSIGLSHHKYNVSYEDMFITLEEIYNGQGPQRININNYTNSFKFLSIDFAFTNNQPVTRNLYIHYGFSSSFSTRILTQALGRNRLKDPINRHLFKNDLDGLALRDIAVVKLGLGYVLF
jgi:hypothetical protein